MFPVPRSTVLFPLYIYPDPCAWNPLYDAISSNPNLQFVVIVNPNSGPGAPPWWPNADYVREIPKLNSYANVQTVGYIRTTYCKRPIEEVLADIGTYARWYQEEGVRGLGVSGIFFDETTNMYSEEIKEYLDAISLHVKETQGILGGRLVGIREPVTILDG
jgi:hypothetical protein